MVHVSRLGAGESVIVTLNDGSKVKGITQNTTDEFITVLSSENSENQAERQKVLRVEKIIKDSALDGALIGGLVGAIVGGLTASRSNLVGETLNSHQGLAAPAQPTKDMAKRKDFGELQWPFSFDLQKALGVTAVGALVGALIDATPQKRLVYQVK